MKESIKKHIDQWILRYPPERKRSGVFEALRVVQEDNGGYLTTELMDEVAEHLQLPKIAVYEVATFYTMFYLEPVGKHIIDVCTNISCMLSGAYDILEYFKKRLNIDVNETSADGKWMLKEVECLGACANAPMCQIGKRYYENLTPEKVDALIERLSGVTDGK